MVPYHRVANPVLSPLCLVGCPGMRSSMKLLSSHPTLPPLFLRSATKIPDGFLVHSIHLARNHWVRCVFQLGNVSIPSLPETFSGVVPFYETKHYSL